MQRFKNIFENLKFFEILNDCLSKTLTGKSKSKESSLNRSKVKSLKNEILPSQHLSRQEPIRRKKRMPQRQLHTKTQNESFQRQLQSLNEGYMKKRRRTL